MVATDLVKEGYRPSKVFQCPEGLLLGRNVMVDFSRSKVLKFQCPEGLLLGRNERPKVLLRPL